MNWIRDNIVKILIILGATVVFIVIFALLAKPRGETTVSGSKYGELETKLQSAAIKYMDKHKKKLPKNSEETTKVTLKTLISNNYIGTITAVDNSSTKCDGYVEITKIEERDNSYRYTPYITCGDYYSTKTIGDYIIGAETEEVAVRTSGDGLYKIDDEYVFRGEIVNNYIMLDSKPYRIIKIDKDKSLQLISVDRTSDSYVWDDRYNVEKNNETGINDFSKSRLYTALENMYTSKTDDDTVEFTKDEKDYIISHDYCIGKRSMGDTNIYSGAECQQTVSLKVGILSLYEYSRASIDDNCKSVFDRSCNNYNYFSTLGKRDSYTYTTLTGVGDNTYQYYRISSGEIQTATPSYDTQLYLVIYINAKTIYSSGTGTADDPYIVR